MATPHDNDAGLISVHKNALTNNYVCLYEAEGQGLDTEGGRYALVCWQHATTLSHTNKKDAGYFARNPTEWCEGCQTEKANLDELKKRIMETVL